MAKRSQSGSPESANKRVHKDGEREYKMSAVETWILCGSCANTMGLIEQAIKSFENAVNHDPASVKALCGLSFSLRLNDISLNQTVGSQNSIERLNKALEIFPDLMKEASLFKELAECYLLIGLNDHAHQSIQTAIQLKPEDASLWLLSAQTLIRAGARTHAAGSLTHCLSLLPSSLNQIKGDDVETARAAHAELAAIAAADGNITLSIAELSDTLSLPPPPLSRIDEHIALWCALATAKERANDIKGALEACERAENAVGSSPRFLIIHSYLLLLANKKEDAEKAINLLSTIVDAEKERGQDEHSEGDFLPWYLLGKSYSLLDQPRAAYDSYQLALRRASNSPITWLAVGKLYLELKQLPDALAAYSQALRLQIDEEGSPGTATAWDGLSCVYERCDDQLMDASDACARSAACFKAIGDVKSSTFFEKRTETLAKASMKEEPIPALREPPDVPSYLLRDLVALLPSERIAFVQGTRQQEIEKSQERSPIQPPNNIMKRTQASPEQANIVPGVPTQHAAHPVPPIPVSHQSAQSPVPPHLYSYKQDQKSPHQQLPPPPPPPPQSTQGGWSSSQPQYFYHTPPPPPGHLPQPIHQHPSVQRSPLVQPHHVMSNGGPYPVGPPGPPPPPPPSGYSYGQYVPIQGGVMSQLQQYTPLVNNWRR